MALRRWLLENVVPEDEQTPETTDDRELERRAKALGLHPSWLAFVRLTPRQLSALTRVTERVRADRLTATIYPADEDVHRWSRLCLPADVRVVIVGQDPYHDGSACGVAFGTTRHHPPPPSLQTIYAELVRTVPGFHAPVHGCLDVLCEQGVLLLNSIFTVVRGLPGSHENLGWQLLSDRVIRSLSDRREHLVFMLWGRHAQEKEYLVDPVRHLILRSGHPSPMAQRARQPFAGNNHFVRANDYLLRHGQRPVDWASLSPDARPPDRCSPPDEPRLDPDDRPAVSSPHAPTFAFFQ